MRKTFAEVLEKLAAEDERIWLLTGDLGYGVLENFASKFPDRYVNCGVAEQNMLGVAAGLALSCKIVFTYSIANFYLRALEQIRNDVVGHNLNVVIVGTGGGGMYASAGPSHVATEDLQIMRCLKGLTVMSPGTRDEVIAIMQNIVGKGPCYLRLGKDGDWGARS